MNKNINYSLPNNDDRLHLRDIVAHVYSNSELSWPDAKMAVHEFFEIIKESLEKKENIEIINLGTWKWRKMKPKIGLNYRTNERIFIPEREILKYSPATTILHEIVGENTIYDTDGESRVAKNRFNKRIGNVWRRVRLTFNF